MRVHPVYVDGQFITTTDSVAVVNPATGQPFARVATMSRAEIASALSAAARAFDQWRLLTAKARGDSLLKIAEQVQLRADEIARTITLENGKPLAQSAGEVAMTIDHIRWFAEEAKRAYGRIIPNWAEAKRNIVIKTPVGVVGAISPWNFPLVLAIRKVAPALAAGCAVVLKPARQTPLACVLFAECVHSAGLPPGVFQLVQGSGSDVGPEFLENPLCRKISFTGSTEVGQTLIRGAAQYVKPLSLELGGHGPCLVFEDAHFGKALDGVMMAKFRNTGQSCIAANRIYVHSPIYDRFVAAFTERVRALKAGDGLDPEVSIGPLIDEAAVAKAEQHVQDALQRGARLLCGGRRGPGPGFFFQPTVLADVTDDSLCSCEETFAPVAPLYRFDTEEEAVARANSSRFALSAYAFTQDLGRFFRLAESLQAGIIGINDGLPTATQAPFGGIKMSGWGRELGMEGLEAFLDTKHISLGL